jgi:acyl-CoA synthetase (AMP-forming)/AMP-acid ligase II
MDVTVIEIPHEKWGESCMALVISVKNADATPQDIQSWANERLAKTRRLAGVAFREEFPRNALGKVLKKELRAPF